MNRYFQVLLMGLCIVIIGVQAHAQVGIGTSTPNASSQLDVVSSNKGILIPRIKLLSSLDEVTITSGNVKSLLVFNTNTTATGSNDVSPGYYYWNGSRWLRLLVGTEVTDNETLTSLGMDVQAGTLTYTDENLNNTILPIKDIVQAHETATDLSQDSDTGMISYTNENNTVEFASVVSADDGNLILAGSDGGAFLDQVDANAVMGSNLTTGNPALISITNGIGATLQDVQVGINPGNDNQVLVTNALGEAAWEDQSALPINVSAINGLFIDNDGLGLGGTLSLPATTITTDVDHTLAIDGLQSGALSDSVVLAGPDLGILKRMSIERLRAEPWLVQGTEQYATKNTDNIYQSGRVAIGSDMPPFAGTLKPRLFVKGAVRGGNPDLTDDVGANSIAMGNRVKASGANAAAFGSFTSASGDGSFAMGKHTTSASFLGTVTGRYNVITTGNANSWIAADPLFQIGNGASSSQRSNALTVRKNGWVGIGFASPSDSGELLRVNGDVRISGTYFTASNSYPDYVFDDYFGAPQNQDQDYHFMGLPEIESYVKKNHHLPGIKSADEVRTKDGKYAFDLTKMSVKNLEKIEELFLHAIVQHNRIEHLKASVESLKAQLNRLEVAVHKMKAQNAKPQKKHSEG